MPSSGVRMGSNRSAIGVVADKWPKKPFLPKVISDTKTARVEGKDVPKKAKKKGT